MEGIRQNALDFVKPHRHNWIGSDTLNDAQNDEQVERRFPIELPIHPQMRKNRRTGSLVGGVSAMFVGILLTTVFNVDRALERFAVIGFMGLGGACIGSDLIAKQLDQED